MDENGFKAPNLEYPVAFGEDGLIGVGTKSAIGGLTAMLFIPQKVIITEELVRESEISDFIKSNEHIFTEHSGSEFLILIAFILFEKLKAEKSFWHPYF